MNEIFALKTAAYRFFERDQVAVLPLSLSGTCGTLPVHRLVGSGWTAERLNMPPMINPEHILHKYTSHQLWTIVLVSCNTEITVFHFRPVLCACFLRTLLTIKIKSIWFDLVCLTAFFHIHNYLSEYERLSYGVPQGCVLGPFRYNIISVVSFHTRLHDTMLHLLWYQS